MPDEDGYPTEEELTRVRLWPYADPTGWFAYIRPLWAYADWGWHEEHEGTMHRYRLSTAGWSGNEDLIAAMKDNRFLWWLTWKASRRGGHYTFEWEGDGVPFEWKDARI